MLLWIRRQSHRAVLHGRWTALGVAARVLRAVRPGLATEERLLRWSWVSRAADGLDEYLVIGWQNPRINVQSILVRHALLRRLFGAEFEELMEAEIRFATELNEALRLESERMHVPITASFDAERMTRVRAVGQVIADREREFEERWRSVLADRAARPISVLELACGSANDYRAFADYGLARFLDYTGVDLNPKNIANARRRYPDIDFVVGNVMELKQADGSVDVVLASDLFEHLPIEGTAKALAEAMRVARHEIVLVFFNMAEVAEHQDRPMAAYHWNRLSRAQVQATLATRFPDVRVTPVSGWLEREFGYGHSYNPRAFSIVAQREVPAPVE